MREQLTDYFEDLVLQRDALKTVKTDEFDPKLQDEVDRLESILDQKPQVAGAVEETFGGKKFYNTENVLPYGKARETGDPFLNKIELACEAGNEDLAAKLLEEW